MLGAKVLALRAIVPGLISDVELGALTALPRQASARIVEQLE